jgi:hypothetical protein
VCILVVICVCGSAGAHRHNLITRTEDGSIYDSHMTIKFDLGPLQEASERVCRIRRESPSSLL